MTLLGRSISEARSLSQDAKIAVASSVTVFVVTSVLFFIIGFLCRHFCQKKKKTDITSQPEETQPQIPYYDSIDQFDIQSKVNVAYGQVSLTNI